ncbi:helix-turn-helix transcriptional regulator [Hazenella sp. IB182353]|uniref:helix-turn-helix domain-containing protein n=1 Tax=Polycladospora coralii TaxID=2771432 RepID=UPI0017468A9D|nr:helix-turn-helix transcriptional regulator [Polycladospora coralii]
MYRTNIRSLRKSRHLSQEALAERCDVTRETINRIENGKYEPSFKLLQRFASELGITLEDLFREQSA